MSEPFTAPSDRHLVVRAPISGYVLALEDVPDPVFAQRLVGDGVSIDPLGSQLVAPIDGRVLQVHPSGHAVTIGDDSGLELMMHIGIDTVQLAGHGFTARVAVGDRVRCGDVLVDFDASYVAAHAHSLLTQVVVTGGGRIVSTVRDHVVAAGRDAVFELELEAAASDRPVGIAVADADRERSASVSLSTPLGLHARPAARLARRARQFAAEVRIERGDRRANAKSVVSLMTLEAEGNSVLRVVARGPDADDAIDALVALIRSGLGDPQAMLTPSAAGLPIAAAQQAASMVAVAPTPPATPAQSGADPNVVTGVPAAPGLVVGSIFQVRYDAIEVQEYPDGSQQEARRLDDALDRARAELETLLARLRDAGDGATSTIFVVQLALLDDPDLLEIARGHLAHGKSAAFAWQRAFTSQVDRVAALQDPLLASRARDVRDAGGRVLRLLTGTRFHLASHPHDAILVASDLTPSDAAMLDRSKVRGFCTVAGGATSHVGILARSMGIPAVAGIHPRALEIPNGTRVLLDGTAGVVRLHPSEQEVARVLESHRRTAGRTRADSGALQPATTRDGHRVDVAANIGSTTEATEAVRHGADGIGLLRSEFLFAGWSVAPDEDIQAESYAAIARTLGPERRLAIRLLDVGGDKPLPFAPAARDPGVFPGERGIRVLLKYPEIFASQVRAILRTQRAGAVSAIVPMVAMLDEWRAAKALFERERIDLGLDAIPLGIMVEVPAVAILADTFAREVDFFSIGTNDLAQYTLAIDRADPALARQLDGLHPSVLRLIARTIDAAHRLGKRVSVCGSLAGEPQAIPVLVGLGVDELSVEASAVPVVKAHVRRISRVDSEQVAQRALDATTAAAVRALVEPLDA